MKKSKFADLSKKELLDKKIELESEIKELLLNASLTSLEKPHKKELIKKEIARISTLVNRGEL